MTPPAVTPPMLLCPPCYTGWPCAKARRRGQTEGQPVHVALLWTWRPHEVIYVARCERCAWSERFPLAEVKAMAALVLASQGPAKRPGKRER